MDKFLITITRIESLVVKAEDADDAVALAFGSLTRVRELRARPKRLLEWSMETTEHTIEDYDDAQTRLEEEAL